MKPLEFGNVEELMFESNSVSGEVKGCWGEVCIRVNKFRVK